MSFDNPVNAITGILPHSLEALRPFLTLAKIILGKKSF